MTWPKDDFGGQDIEIDEFIWPPAPFEYNPNGIVENDIIILKLKTPLDLNESNENVHPTALPPSLTFAENSSFEKCIVSGWGKLNSSKFNTLYWHYRLGARASSMIPRFSCYHIVVV